MSAKPPRGKSGGKRRQTDREDGGGSASVMSSKGVSAAPEVVYKMSKKIAQLTKVIYYLNTKNEDHNVEVQSLIDAYEEELSDAIKDGTGQIQELRAKLDECNIKIQAQDAVIQSYLETISQNERELQEAKSVEEDIREQLHQMERNLGDMENRLQSEVEKSEGLTSISALSTESLRSDHDAEVKRICDKYEEKIAKLTETHEKQIIELQLQSSKTIKVYSDECKSAQEQLKDIVDVLSKQHDEKIRVYQNEAKDVREFYEAKLKDAEKESKATVVQLKEEVQELRTVNDTQGRQNLEYEEKIRVQTDKIRDINSVLSEKLLQMSTMQASLVSESSKAESLKRELNIANERLSELSDRSLNLEQELTSKNIQLAQNEAGLRSTKDTLEKTQLELDTLTQSLDSAISTIRELNERIHDLNRAKADSDVMRIEKERAFKQLLDEMEEMEKNMKEDKVTSLLHQEAELKAAFDSEMKAKIIQLDELRISLLQEKQNEINNLLEKIIKQSDEAKIALEKEKEQFNIQKAALEEIIRNLEDARTHVKDQLTQVSATLDERIKEIATHLQTIKNLHQTIKGLEVDKADMFQKMLRIDDQIRTEMNEKFRQEKVELEEDLADQHELELEKLRDSLMLEHHMSMKAAMQKIENEYGSKIAKMTEEHLLRNEEWEVKRAELEKRLNNNVEEIKIMLKTILELKESHAKKVAELIDNHQKLLEAEKKNWDFEASAKETQLKVSSTIALNNLEKKYKLQLDELETSHRKQLDELRKEHTISTLALKKDAENQKTSDLAKQKTQYEEQIEKTNQAHINEMAQTVLAMNIQRIADLKAANEVHEGHLREKDGDISRLNTTIKEHLVLEDELRQKIEENEIEINSLHQDLVFKGEEIANLQAESLKAIQDKEVELANEQSENIRRLHEEHITEAEKMVIEFDKAQSFLKKQIAAQAKQLQDADLRYINREPREADLQRIAELEDDIKRRKRKITALTEELDYYRLELNNREANFNKIFNKTPLVGVIEPLKFSPKGNKKETPSRLPPLFTSQTLNAALATSRTPSEI